METKIKLDLKALSVSLVHWLPMVTKSMPREHDPKFRYVPSFEEAEILLLDLTENCERWLGQGKAVIQLIWTKQQQPATALLERFPERFAIFRFPDREVMGGGELLDPLLDFLRNQLSDS